MNIELVVGVGYVVPDTNIGRWEGWPPPTRFTWLNEELLKDQIFKGYFFVDQRVVWSFEILFFKYVQF